MSDDDFYETSDKNMVMVLVMLFGSEDTEKQDRKIIYKFSRNKRASIALRIENEVEVKELALIQVIGMILSGKANEILFSYGDLWRAEQTWQANLRHYQMYKRSD